MRKNNQGESSEPKNSQKSGKNESKHISQRIYAYSTKIFKRKILSIKI